LKTWFPEQDGGPLRFFLRDYQILTFWQKRAMENGICETIPVCSSFRA
jgi:hypothetical protein